jgi:DNA-binding MarR family transcriptional regulator
MFDITLSLWLILGMAQRPRPSAAVREPATTSAGQAATALMLEIFRVNGRLLGAGDRLVGEIGLTSARWQVLGAIALSPTAEPVARLARNMGLTRQGVQRIVNELQEEGVVAFTPNPHHRRAHLLVLTERGKQIYAAAESLERPWAERLARGIPKDTLIAARRTLEALRHALEAATSDDAL